MRLHLSMVLFAALLAAALGTIAILSFASPPAGAVEAVEGDLSSTVVRLSDNTGLNLAVARCVGMGSSSEVVQFRDGTGETNFIPGPTKPARVACERALTTDVALSQWRDSIVNNSGSDRFRTLEITMFNAAFEPVAKWTVDGAWPSDLTVIPAAGGGLNEVVTFVGNRVTRVQP